MRFLEKKLLLTVSISILLLFLSFYPLSSAARFFTVVNAGDSGPGSLRACIDSVNAIPGHDTIDFYIAPSGVQTISVLSPLPQLLDPAGVLIDGLTEPGASIGANPPSTLTLMVVIDGTFAGSTGGFVVKTNNNIIRGLVINNFDKDGISIEAGPFHDAANNVIQYNIIGLDHTGLISAGNGYDSLGLWAGVRIYNIPAEVTALAFNNLIRENLISSNYSEGVEIIGPQVPGDVFGNIVKKNYIGTDITGSVDMGNFHDGVALCEGTHDNLVDSNLISGNDYDGIGIQGYNNEPFPAPPIQTSFNIITNNIIGLTIDHIPLGNNYDGVSVGQYGPTNWGCADNNMIGPGNTIAYNGEDGVCVWEDFINKTNADGNLITQNSIFDNYGLGIDLADDGITMNDPADVDSGPNQELNFPDNLTAVDSSGTVIVRGTIDVDSDPTTCIVELFKVKADPSGHGEGMTYLGFTNPDSMGDWDIRVTSLMAGDSITTTTSDVYSNTSEFSDNVEVIASGIPDMETIIPFGIQRIKPNPFSNSTSIELFVSETSNLNINICNATGRIVFSSGEKKLYPGYYRMVWNGLDDTGRKLPSGVYMCYVNGEILYSVEKIILIR